jgi:glycosyltransferase involved in cell wall biosynthesis
VPRVTLGIATYDRDTYLEQALSSSLAQDYGDFEVLVVLDGSTNPGIQAVLDRFDDPRLRVIAHERNLGIAAAYNTFVSAGHGELIAMLGDDDVCMPDRLRRQVELFDAHPDTGIVHGDALIIDENGAVTGTWPSRELAPSELVRSLFRVHNELVDPTRMVHRRVHDAVGGYDSAYPIAQDFDFWLRAARDFRFRHCPGGPIVGLRRHGANTSDESAREREIADVERALEAAMERLPLSVLVPELDWSVLDPGNAARAALLRLADAVEQRRLPLPGLAGRLRSRAEQIPVTSAPRRRREGAPRRLVMTAFGWEDSGGGTTVPRLAAKALAQRGWEVTVFHAAVGRTDSGQPYELREWEQDGVSLVGVHNRAHGLFDIGNPQRELDDPPITAAFAALLDRVRPHAVHFHNLHNLGAALLDQAAARAIPSFFTTHNYWLICPRAYLLTGAGSMCPGPGDRGGDCAACVGSHDRGGHQARLAEIRARAQRSLTACLTVSHAVRDTLLAQGYSPDLLDVVRQAMPHEQEIWEQVGSRRVPGRADTELTVAFVGSAYPHKGPQLLIEAAQRTQATVKVRVHGELPERFGRQLAALDRRGVVELAGAFSPAQLGGLLAAVDAVALPSAWWDCAPLAAAECLAARVPLLVPRLGGLPEAVRDGVDGLTFDGLDVDDLARQLDRLATEPGLLERLQASVDPPRPFDAYIDDLEAYYEGGRPGFVDPRADAAEPAVSWHGDHGRAVSLSIINRAVTSRLPGPVECVERDGSRAAGAVPLPHAADVEVRHQWPPDLRPARSGRLAVIQPWEFGAVPREWVEEIVSNVDELWVPSEHVRRMYVEGGVAADRVVTIPNGVDAAVFTPNGVRYEIPGDQDATRFLFVGGLIWRKGQDVLLSAWREAFAGRGDVLLIVKDVGASDIYRNGARADFLAHATSGELPRVLVLQDELSESELASLYRACDVLVHPYRGEGFAMPVLEAMASGLPVITTAGGPTDEFCPPDAGWRISSTRGRFPSDRVDRWPTVGTPWVLEPDTADLVGLLRAAAADGAERARRGAAGRRAALTHSWDSVAASYAARLRALRRRPPLLAGPAGEAEPYPLADTAPWRLLATPAWRGRDRLGELLADWCASPAAGVGASLVLLADPRVDGTSEELEARVLAAAASAGADLDGAGDINILMEPQSAQRDARLHAAVNAYAVLHAGAPGHVRLARAAGNEVIEPGAGTVAAWLAAPAAA